MTGLMEKDMRLLFSNKQTILAFVAISVILGFSMEGTFILGYFPFLIVILMVGTISYDEMDHGFQFLMTLPVDPGLYVREKYCLCLLGGVFSWVASVGIYEIGKIYRGEALNFLEELPMISVFLPMMLVLIAFMLPIQIKFGVEKSRAVLAGFCGGIGVVVIFITKTILTKEKLSQMAAFADRISEPVLTAVCFAATAGILLVSYGISKKLMEKKEY